MADIEGLKYIVVGADGDSPAGDPAGIVDAVETLLDRERYEDRVVVAGSLRPVAEWKIPEGMTRHGVFVCWPGVTLPEARVVEETVGDVRNSAATVILRVRIRKGSYARIKKAAEYERQVFKDGKKDQYVSTFCLVPIMEHVEAVEAARRAADAADFSGGVVEDATVQKPVQGVQKTVIATNGGGNGGGNGAEVDQYDRFGYLV